MALSVSGSWCISGRLYCSCHLTKVRIEARKFYAFLPRVATSCSVLTSRTVEERRGMNFDGKRLEKEGDRNVADLDLFPPAFRTFLKDNNIDPAIYSLTYSLPRYIRFKSTLKAEALSELAADLGSCPEPLQWLPGFFILPANVTIAGTRAYKTGQMFGMDAASGAAVAALRPLPGDHVLDLCAAPGAKLCMIADLLGPSGTITAVDVAQPRLAACRTMLVKYNLADRCRLYLADGTLFAVGPPRPSSFQKDALSLGEGGGGDADTSTVAALPGGTGNSDRGQGGAGDAAGRALALPGGTGLVGSSQGTAVDAVEGANGLAVAPSAPPPAAGGREGPSCAKLAQGKRERPGYSSGEDPASSSSLGAGGSPQGAVEAAHSPATSGPSKGNDAGKGTTPEAGEDGRLRGVVCQTSESDCARLECELAADADAGSAVLAAAAGPDPPAGAAARPAGPEGREPPREDARPARNAGGPGAPGFLLRMAQRRRGQQPGGLHQVGRRRSSPSLSAWQWWGGGSLTNSSTAGVCARGYDKVLVDAECTHDGSLKHICKYDEWGWGTDLLSNGFRHLRPGGTLVYSTCSFTLAQNEDVVRWFVGAHREHGAELVPVEGAQAWPCKPGGIPHTLRFDPVTSNTSGLFIACFTKRARSSALPAGSPHFLCCCCCRCGHTTAAGVAVGEAGARLLASLEEAFGLSCLALVVPLKCVVARAGRPAVTKDQMERAVGSKML
eukprot:jgi/Mesen1/3408/ME000192S02576